MNFLSFIIDFFRPSSEELKGYLEQANQTSEEFAHEHGLSTDLVDSWLDGVDKIPFKYSSVIYFSRDSLI